ncbi:MAG: DMT family transporter [Anaerolineae bacterium]|nr:DMT family transporter [Anaerolineae bacterium]
MSSVTSARPASGAGVTRAGLVLLIGVLVMAWASILVRWAEAPPLVVGAGRLSAATLVLAPLALPATMRELPGLSRRRRALIGVSGVALGLHFAAWLASLGLTTVASSVVLVSTTPLFVAVASPLILGERVELAMIVAVLLAMAGAITIGLADARVGTGGLLGDLLALVGALMASVYVLVGRVVRRELSLLAYIWPTYGLAAVVLLLGCALAGQSLLGYGARTYAMLGLLALGPQLVGHSSVNWALRYLSPTFVTVAVLGEPLGATGLALLLLAERPGWRVLLGAVILLLGIGLAVRSEKRARPA